MHGWRHIAAGCMLTWQSRRSSRRFAHAVLSPTRGRFSRLDSRAFRPSPRNIGAVRGPRLHPSPRNIGAVRGPGLAFAFLAEVAESWPGDRVPFAAIGDRGKWGPTNRNRPARKNRRPHNHHHWRREEERIEEKPGVPAIAGRTEPERLPKTVGAAKRVVVVKRVRIRSKVPIPVPSGLIVLVVQSVVVGIAGNVIGS